MVTLRQSLKNKNQLRTESAWIVKTYPKIYSLQAIWVSEASLTKTREQAAKLASLAQIGEWRG